MSIPPFLHSESLTINDLKLFQDIGSIKTFQKGEKIFSQNEPSTQIVIVMQGFVKLSKMTDSENSITRAIFPMQLIGESVPFEQKLYPVSAHFMTNGLAIIIAYSQFKQLFSWSPKIALSMFNLVNKSQLHLFQEMENKRVLSTAQRVASFLLEYQTLLPQLMHKEMAVILSLASETFSRQITKLKVKRAIVVKDGKIELNENKLRRLVL